MFCSRLLAAAAAFFCSQPASSTLVARSVLAVGQTSAQVVRATSPCRQRGRQHWPRRCGGRCGDGDVFALSVTFPVSAGLAAAASALVHDRCATRVESSFLTRDGLGRALCGSRATSRGFALMQTPMVRCPGRSLVAPAEVYARRLSISRALAARLKEAEDVVRLGRRSGAGIHG